MPTISAKNHADSKLLIYEKLAGKINIKLAIKATRIKLYKRVVFTTSLYLLFVKYTLITAGKLSKQSTLKSPKTQLNIPNIAYTLGETVLDIYRVVPIDKLIATK